MALLKLQSFLLAAISWLSTAPGVPYFDSRAYSSGRTSNFRNAKDFVSTTIRVEANAWDVQNEPLSLTRVGLATQGAGLEEWHDKAGHSPRCKELLETAGLSTCDLQTCWHDQKKSEWHFAVDCCADRMAFLLLRLIGDCSGSFSSASTTETSSHLTGRTTIDDDSSPEAAIPLSFGPTAAAMLDNGAVPGAISKTLAFEDASSQEHGPVSRAKPRAAPGTRHVELQHAAIETRFDVHSQHAHEDVQERLRLEAKVKTALAEVGVSSLDGLSRLLSTLSPEPLRQSPPGDSGTLEASQQNADHMLEAPKQNSITSNSMLEAPQQNSITSNSMLEVPQQNSITSNNMLEAPKQNSFESNSMLEAPRQYTGYSNTATTPEASEQKAGRSAADAVVFTSSGPRTGAAGIAVSDVHSGGSMSLSIDGPMQHITTSVELAFALDHTDKDGNFQINPFWTPGRRLRHRASSIQGHTIQWFVDYAQWAWLPGLALVFVVCMYPGHRGDRFGNQFGAGPGGLGSLKVPPSWCAERSQEYTFRAWLADVVLWAGATDLEAERHGPAVAMQVHGSAREIIREIPAQLLRNGRVNQQGQVETGLMVLMRTLADRYSPLEVESSTRSIAELINFKRLGGETIDGYLTRFDVLRNRAEHRGNLHMAAPGLAWMLLNGLRASPEVWDRALLPFNGDLPQDNGQLAVLIERLRRQGHLHEQHGIAQIGRDTAMRQGGLGSNATYFFPTFGAGEGYANNNYNNSTGREDGYFPTGDAGDWTMDGSGGNGACPACGHYCIGDDSSATSSDDGQEAFFGDAGLGANLDPNELGNILHNDYHMAKRRWRRFQNKIPRRKRRFGKGQGKSTTFASFLPSRAFAGGKGKSSGKGRRNPADANGRVLRCHSCGSEEHLIKHCPNRSAHLATSSTSATAPSANFPTMMTGATGCGNPLTVTSWHTRSSDLDDLVQMLPKRSRQDAGGTGVGTGVVRLLPGATDPKHPPPTWSPSLPTTSQTSSRAPTSPTRNDGCDMAAESAPPRATSVHSMQDHYSDVDSSVSQDVRRTTVEDNMRGLSQLLQGRGRGSGSGFHFPWWHSDCPVEMVYHTKTRLRNGKAALLVDPGAHGNLVGSQTMAQLVAQAASFGHSSQRRRLTKQMSVEGVGKHAQVAQHEQEVAIGFKDERGNLHAGKFSAPVIEDSALPPLWGRQSLAAQRALLDLGNNRLVLPGPGGVDLRLSPGSMSLPLTLSESGHLLLEVHHFGAGSEAKHEATGVHSFKTVSFERGAPAAHQKLQQQGRASASTSN